LNFKNCTKTHKLPPYTVFFSNTKTQNTNRKQTEFTKVKIIRTLESDKIK